MSLFFAPLIIGFLSYCSRCCCAGYLWYPIASWCLLKGYQTDELSRSSSQDHQSVDSKLNALIKPMPGLFEMITAPIMKNSYSTLPSKASNPGRALFKQEEECRPEP